MELVNRFLKSSRSIWIVLLIHFVVWMAVSSLLNIHPDMADHWVWSRFLSFGYYEHPPMVALTMRIATLIGGNSVLTLKIGSVLFSVLILYTGYRVATLFFDRKTALIFILILESTPYFSVGSVFWHIDQPYMFFWLLCLYAIGKYIITDNSNWIFLFGCAAGFGAMSKYIMILLPVALLIWCLLSKQNRKLLLQWQTYAAAAIALAIVAPNIYWNYQHNWITFVFVLKKGLIGARFGEPFVQFLISQFFLFSFIYFPYLWWNLGRKHINSTIIFESSDKRTEKWLFLLVSGFVPVVLFTLSSFTGKGMDPHWVNVGYFSLFMLLARFISIKILEGEVRKQVVMFASSCALTLVFLSVFLAQIFFNIFPEVPHLRAMVDWEKSSDQIEALFDDRNMPIPDFVISKEYQLSSVLSIYMRNQPMPHSIEKWERNQWSLVPNVKKAGAFLVCPPTDCKKLLVNAENKFKSSFDYIGEIKTENFGWVSRKLKVYRMSQ